MGSHSDHETWSDNNAQMARRLAADTSDSTGQRWAVVVAYYAVMHKLQAVAAAQGDQVSDHRDIIEIPSLHNLQGALSLEKRTRELFNFCNKARYLRGSGSKAADWYQPYAPSAEDLVASALSLMESVLADL